MSSVQHSDTSRPELFKHSPLLLKDSTRLVLLLPAKNPRDPIECQLIEVPLGSPNASETREYEALSYVWGARTGHCPILCHGKSLLVTENCLAALIQLRQPTETRTLWIDTICITQSQGEAEVEERNLQVAKMGQIFAEAKCVVVWLGAGNKSAWAALERLRKHGVIDNSLSKGAQENDTYRPLSGFRDLVRLPRELGQGINEAIQNLSFEAKIPFQGNLAKGFSELMANPWFERIWSFQEIAFAREALVQCGPSCIPWTLFVSSLDKFQNFSQAKKKDDSRYYAVQARAKARQLLQQGSGLSRDIPEGNRRYEIELLQIIFRHKAGWLHDKVYGIYAMFKAIGIQSPAPDYSKPRRQVFEEFTRAYIESRRSLDILALSVRPNNPAGGDEDASLPSWVPLWTRTYLPKAWPIERTGMLYFSSEWPATLFNAARNSSYRSDIATYQPGRLRVRGHHIGTIIQRGAASPFSDTHVCPSFPFTEHIPVFQRWCRMVRDIQAYLTGESPLDAFRRTLLFYYGDRGSRAKEPTMSHIQYTPTDDIEAFRKWYKLMLDPEASISVKSLPNTSDLGKLETHPVDDNVTISAHLERLDRKNQRSSFRPLNSLPIIHWGVSRLLQYAFFLLDSGYMGIGSHHCKHGDAVYILESARCPVVLRPLGRAYSFVVAAYVHGVMNGERWPDDENTLEDLVLE
ncbi:heterokaryon incompatibility protein-domain-containing protein [Xylariaceae sp. FL0255]|nr:heterokaryon incompatibility protein-domain-containing protein [Xylariaceae sp. FL0255]